MDETRALEPLNHMAVAGALFGLSRIKAEVVATFTQESEVRVTSHQVVERELPRKKNGGRS